ncbi:hypothetical protein [Desulfoscipio gibsoniae]
MVTNKLSFIDNFSEQNKIFKDAVLDIQRNVFKTKDSLIQISNISMIWVGEVIKKQYSIWSLALIFAGLALFFSPVMLLRIVGLFFMAISGYSIYQVYNYNKENRYALHIEMNSGGRFILTSESIDFLNQAASFVAKTINEYGLEGQANNYYIDFSNNTIKNENGIVNTGHVGGGISNE